jgi:basic membrane lipoprotein Med (substrate-binding protein (PBP1-ABC) superfamily)
MGVSEVNPDATFLNGFIGAWFDPARAKEAAIAQIDAGAPTSYSASASALPTRRRSAASRPSAH